METTPWIQVSIDTQDVPTGLRQVKIALSIGAEWIEAGTPLITFAGIEAIGAIAAAAPGRTVVADFKALDGVAQYFTRAGELGAGVATVMAIANDASVNAAIQAGHAAGVKIQVDMLNVPVPGMAECARMLEQMGADYLLLHLGIDDLMQNPDADPLAGLDELVASTGLPVGPVVFNLDQGIDAVHRGAAYVVVGYPLITMADAAAQLQRFSDGVRTAGSELAAR